MISPIAAQTPPLSKSLQDNPGLGRWLDFSRQGMAIARSGKVELGQGINTALAQIVADALGLPLAQVEMAAPDTATSPDEGFTAGSQSVELSGSALRLVATQSRALLAQAALLRLNGRNAGPLSCIAGAFHDANGAVGLDYWSVAADVDWSCPVDPGTVLPTGQAVGTNAPRADLPGKIVQGGFIHDLTLEGMLHARVVRQPHRLAVLAQVDEAWLARRYPGVRILRQQDFLALIGKDEYPVHAAHAAAELFTTWQDATLGWQAPQAAPEWRDTTPPDAAPLPATFSAEYARGYIAHGSIGPSCGLAWFKGGMLTVWTHSQGIFPLRAQIAKATGLAPQQVRVIHAHGSGCYGHNGADDAALDAALIAMQSAGQPVRVQWSRADELGRGPFGAAMSAQIAATLGADGRIANWSMSVTSAPHAQRPGGSGNINLTSAEALDAAAAPRRVEDLPMAAGGGAARNAVPIYDLAQRDIRAVLTTGSALRTSSLRSLGAHLNVFAIESAMDELAEMAGADPLAFRLAHLTDVRCRAVLQGVAEMSGWHPDAPLGEGRACGLAVARYKNKGAWLAAVAEVEVDEAVSVRRLWLCADAGRLINPEGARNQIEGGAIQTISWTLKEQVPVDAAGRVPVLDWDAYPILRFSEVPQIETRFIEPPGAPPLGAGEASQGPVAAALANAVARALGARVRQMPMTRERILQCLLDA